MAALPPVLAPLAFLVGTWEGEGRGLWRADPPYRYRERVTIGCDGRPFLRYEQHTANLDDGAPRHTEMGYVRCPSPEGVEMLVVQATGIGEIQVGRVVGTRLVLASRSVSLTPTAKPVTAVAREIWLEDDDLCYLVRIAMNAEPLGDHLSARLHRVG